MTRTYDRRCILGQRACMAARLPITRFVLYRCGRTEVTIIDLSPSLATLHGLIISKGTIYAPKHFIKADWKTTPEAKEAQEVEQSVVWSHYR